MASPREASAGAGGLAVGRGLRIFLGYGVRAVTAPAVWSWLGVWTVVAIILVAVAYAYPRAHPLSLERFGSPPFRPF
jgi:hypothetical protein